MNMEKFFAALRRRNSGVFGTSLSQAQVQGINAILASCGRNGVDDIHHVSQCLAQPYKETGGYMLGIKETVYPHHTDKRPSDALVIKRLDRAWAKGQLRWVKTPYWRDGAFGRGPIQTTHWRNYIKMGKRLGIDLRSNPNLILAPDIGADSAVIGMSEGLYTGKKLSDYRFPKCLEIKKGHNRKGGGYTRHPRRIVNGKDGTDARVSEIHWAFHNALTVAGYEPGCLADSGAPKDEGKDGWIKPPEIHEPETKVTPSKTVVVEFDRPGKPDDAKRDQAAINTPETIPWWLRILNRFTGKGG